MNNAEGNPKKLISAVIVLVINMVLDTITNLVERLNHDDG